MGIEQSDKKGIQYIVASLAALGVSKVVICPGSRNAPLTISFNRHPQFSCISIRDERSAAFVALGMAAECKEPVVVVCTSGSAALNFAPAVAEAFYQRIPLIVVTADRPKAWTGQGDGQTLGACPPGRTGRAGEAWQCCGGRQDHGGWFSRFVLNKKVGDG